MIDKKLIEQIVEEKISNTDYFLVDVTVSLDNTVCVEIDRNDGVDLQFCVEVNKFIEEKVDREVEDYSLEVGSAGLTSPFKVQKQYEKNIGNDVEVLLKTGVKHKGILTAVNATTFTIEESKMQKKEGDKRKKEYIETLEFNYEEIKTTKYIINFK